MTVTKKTTEHYYTPKPTSTPVKQTITANIKGIQFTFLTESGVFSKDKIDLGTNILLENVDIKPESTILDLGCGYGPVGIVLAKIFPSTKIVMTDVNQRATKLAYENAQQNNVIVDVRTGDGYASVPEKFDYILLNPPQTAGRALCFALIENAPAHLNNQGIFYLIARHKKGGEVLATKMKTVFGNVDVVARESGFRVYKSVKNHDS